MEKNIKITVIVVVSICFLVALVLGLKSSGMLFGPKESITECSDKIDNDGDGRCDYGTRVKCKDGAVSGDA